MFCHPYWIDAGGLHHLNCASFLQLPPVNFLAIHSDFGRSFYPQSDLSTSKSQHDDPYPIANLDCFSGSP